MGTSKMKIDLCNYSGYKVYPSRGITYIKADGKTFRFLDGRSKKAHMLKRNPRKVTWTVLYRRKHRKGVEEEAAKKRTKRTHKFQRAIVGASLNEILAKRNQKPELRKAQRDEAIRAAKEVNKSKGHQGQGCPSQGRQAQVQGAQEGHKECRQGGTTGRRKAIENILKLC